jgi:hypothetical protein
MIQVHIARFKHEMLKHPMSECIIRLYLPLPSSRNNCHSLHVSSAIYFLIILVGIGSRSSPSPEFFFNESVILPYQRLEPRASASPNVCLNLECRWQLGRKLRGRGKKSLSKTRGDGSEWNDRMSLDLDTIVLLKLSGLRIGGADAGTKHLHPLQRNLDDKYLRQSSRR